MVHLKFWTAFWVAFRQPVDISGDGNANGYQNSFQMLINLWLPGDGLYKTFFCQALVGYGDCARSKSGGQNLAVLPKRHDNSPFLRS